jgi:hypothetical protein
VNNLIVSINEYDSELHEFAILFHQDFDEMPEFSNEMVLSYLARLRLDDKRKENLSGEFDSFLCKIESLDKNKRLDLWFKLGAHYWNSDLDMYTEIEKYKKLLK